MNSRIFLLASALFLFCLLIHILIWRSRRPPRDAPAILFIFLFAGPLLFILSSKLLFAIATQNIFAVLLLHLSLSCAYIQIYPASQADSPSLRILILVNRAPQGLTEQEIRNSFNEEDLLEARLEDLIMTGLIARKGTELSLTSKGKGIIVPFIMIRRILGLKLGEG